MADQPATWIMNPATFDPDPEGITWGLAVRSGVFLVHRVEPNGESVATTHRGLDDALATLPPDIATFLRSHGSEMVVWSVEMDADQPRPPAKPDCPGVAGGLRRGGPQRQTLRRGPRGDVAPRFVGP